MKDRIGVRGVVRAVLRDAEGRVLYEEKGENLVVTLGKEILGGLLIGAGTLPIQYMGIGTGTDAVLTADTELQTEIATGGGERALASFSLTTTTTTNDTVQYIGTYSFTDSFSVAEAGLFDAVSSGNMFARKLFASPIAVISGNVLEVTWDIIF